MSKKCQNCGAEMSDDMNFCPRCHAKYEASVPGSAVSLTPQSGTEALNENSHQAPKVQLPFWAKMRQPRIKRRDFWICALICGALLAVVQFIPVVGQIISLIFSYFLVCFCWSRLHDAGKSAWNLLWYFLPIIGWIILIVLYCQPSEKGENAWGPEPQRMFGE